MRKSGGCLDLSARRCRLFNSKLHVTRSQQSGMLIDSEERRRGMLRKSINLGGTPETMGKFAILLGGTLVIASCNLLLSCTFAPSCSAQGILPAREDAPGGGNPFEGLGRPDDPNPSRIGDYVPGTSVRTQPQTQPATPGVKQPSSLGVPGYNSYNTQTPEATKTAQAQATPAELEALSPNDPTAPAPPPPLDSSANSFTPPVPLGQPSLGQPSLGQPSLGQPSLAQPSLGQPNALPSLINSLGAGQVPQGTVFGTTNDPGLLSRPDDLMPPPPPLTTNTPPPSPPENTPIKQAMGLTNLRKYNESIAKLKELDARQPNDPQIHYLLAVNYVLTRRYAEARSEYQLVERLAKGTDLATRAAEGIRKISNK